MKIGILTQPLHNNYGGLLQNYALQTVLKRMGHEVWTINRDRNRDWKYKSIAISKRLILRTVFQRKDIVPIIPHWENKSEKEIISLYTNQFIQNELTVTPLITSKSQMGLIRKYNFDIYIVGSDQVWRPMYSPHLPTYFLDFADNNDDLKKIAYAASFGSDQWELSPRQTSMAKKHIKKFNAVSVREDTAVTQCKQHLGVNAQHVLDPTMLLTKNDYIDLVEQNNESPINEGDLFTYILDRNDSKSNVVKNVSHELGLTSFEIMPEKFPQADISKCIYPSVYKWIRSFIDAKFIITDSFHGTVFSIIFAKPFISIINKERGVARFNSLLQQIGLEDRLVTDYNGFNKDLLLKKINYKNVTEKLNSLRYISLNFINQNIQ